VKRWKAVREDIINALRDDRNIVVLGYSQGAAIALLAFEDINFTYPYKIVAGEVFGCPRVVSWLSGNIWDRFEHFTIHNNRRDIVGKIPFVSMGYRHVNKPVFTGPHGLACVKDHLIAQYERYL
jgi:predicted lipase